MVRTVGAMYVAKISRRHGDREYDSYLVRHSGQGGLPAAVGVRSAEPGRDRLRAAVSRPAAGRVPHPPVAEQRARKRSELLAGTEEALGEIKRRVDAGTLQGQAEIGLAVGAVWKPLQGQETLSGEHHR